MYKSLVTFLTVFCCGMFIFSPPIRAGDFKPKLAILSFVPQNIEATSYMESLPALLIAELKRKDFFILTEKKQLDKAFELEGYKLTSVTPAQIMSIGNKQGIDFIIAGTVKKEKGRITAEVKSFDIPKQLIFFEYSLNSTDEGLTDKIKDLVSKIIEKISQTTLSSPARGQSPDPPSNLQAQESSKKIILSWAHKALNTLTGFKIFRKNKETDSLTYLGSTHETSWVDENPLSDESSLYQIKAIGRDGKESDFSPTLEARTIKGPPPPILMNVEPNIKAAHLKFRAYPGKDAAKFKIYRQEATTKESVAVATVAAADTLYLDKGLKDDLTYIYALTAIDAKNVEGERSKPLEVKTFKAPEEIKAEGGKIRRVTVSWKTHQAPVVAGYNLYRAPEKNGEYKLLAKIEGKSNIVYSDLKGLGDATTYWYRVSAFNKDGLETDFSEAASATTRGVPPIPQGLTTKEREPRKVSIRWNPVISPEDEIGGYYLYRSNEEKGEYQKIAHLKNPKAESHNDQDPPLKDNTTYYYKISSYNSAGATSDFSAPASATTKNIPALPQGLKAQSGEVKKITLSWEANPEKDIREYVIFRAVPGSNKWEKIAAVKNKTSFTDLNLECSFTYSYALKVIDEDKLESEQSSPASGTTKPLPQKPTGLKIVEQNGQKILQWDMNPEKDIKEYIIYKKGFLGLSQKVGTAPSNSWIIDEKNLKKGQTVYITAFDEAGLESEGSALLVIDK